MGTDDVVAFILSGIRRFIRPFLAETDHVIGRLCLFFGRHGLIVAVMCVVVIRGIIAFSCVIQARYQDFLRFLDAVASVLPVIYGTVPSCRLLFHDYIGTIRQICGYRAVLISIIKINGQGRYIGIRTTVFRTVPLNTVNGVKIVGVERL